MFDPYFFKKIFLKIHFLNGKCRFETIKKSFRKHFIAKHCNVSKYLFPFEGVAMLCATLPYSFALLFLFRLNHFLNVTLAVLVPLKFFFFGMNLQFSESIVSVLLQTEVN